MSDEDLDPEIVADLRLRARTVRERGGRDVGPLYDWTKPKLVAEWECRAPSCGTTVGVTEETLERLVLFEAMLRRRGEAPLDKDRIVFCDECRDARRRAEATSARAAVDTLAAVIRRFKASTEPEEQRALIKQLRELGHPHVDELAAHVAAAAPAARRKRQVREDL